MDNFEKDIRKFYLFYGFLKGLAFASLGLLLATNFVSVFWMAAILVASGILMVFTALIGDYSRDMKWHKTLIAEVGEEYETLLAKAIADFGLGGIVRRDWFVRTFEELYWKPRQEQRK